MNPTLGCLVGLAIGFIAVLSIFKYIALLGGPPTYTAKFFGPHLAFFMNHIPIIPEVFLIATGPFWVMYWLLRGVGHYTRYVDKKWKELNER